MSLEEKNVEYILDQYKVDQRDRYKILSTVAQLVNEVNKLMNENIKLVKELNKKVLRNDLPVSLQKSYSKRDSGVIPRKSRNRRR